MTSRANEKRSLRKCQPSLESLTARIAPAGFHAGSLFVGAVHQEFLGTGAGNHHKHHNGTPFIVRSQQNHDTANAVIKGQKPTVQNGGPVKTGKPFLNLIVNNVNAGFPSTPSTTPTSSTGQIFIVRQSPAPLFNSPTTNSGNSDTTPTSSTGQIFIVRQSPVPVFNSPTTNSGNSDTTPPSSTGQIFIVR